MGFSSGFTASLLTDVDGSPLADVYLLPQPGLDGGRHGAHGRGNRGGGRLQGQSAVLSRT